MNSRIDEAGFLDSLVCRPRISSRTKVQYLQDRQMGLFKHGAYLA